MSNTVTPPSSNQSSPSQMNQSQPNAMQSNEHPNSHPNPAIAQWQRRLGGLWLVWLIYRGVALPALIGWLHPLHPDIVAGIFWHLLWLLPAMVFTPWLWRGRSAYALLLASMLTVLYLGASAVVLFSRYFDTPLWLLPLYGVDVLLILLINVALFRLLKILPSMNRVAR